MDRLIDKVYQKISNKIKRKLTTQEHVYLISSINNIDIAKYKENLSDVSVILSDILGKTIEQLSSSSPQPVDMHEFFKKELASTEQIYKNKIDTPDITPSENITVYDANIIQLFNLLTTQDLINTLNPSSNYEREYLVLDSRYAYSETNNKTIWKWDYAATKNIREHTVNSLGKIRNLIGIKLYSLTIPNSPDIEACPGYVSMLIEEFANQSFQTNTPRQYHFMLNRVPHLYLTYYIELITADNGDGIFKFDPPILEFNTLTVTFGNPNTLCSLQHPFLEEGRFIIPIEFTYLKNTS